MKTKLVRDKITEGPNKIRPCNSDEGKQLALCLKLHEEAGEIADCPSDPSEYADMLEVMLELARLNGVNWSHIEKALVQKRKVLGGFRKGHVLIYPPKRHDLT
jgi:predicted house-cleaning noncanonical NTP pyrophosphatase (MazG superfamily)